MTHTWIEGYENIYSITKEGKLFRHLKSGKIKECKGSLNSDGYLLMSMCVNSKPKQEYIHRLVAKTFIPNPNNYTVVDHINENKLDNNVENLRWCTLQQNADFYYEQPERKQSLGHIKHREKQVQNKYNYLKEVEENLSIEKSSVKKDVVALEATIRKLTKEKMELLKIINDIEKEFNKLEIKYRDYLGDRVTLLKTKFKSNKERIAKISRCVYVNKVRFESTTQAAKFIAENENKSVQTIRKEIRNYLNGKRSSWYMYDKYLIE